jgi:diguanylate cyclase (GGDEF)-like protein/PAS domain S-box-containing protein
MAETLGISYIVTFHSYLCSMSEYLEITEQKHLEEKLKKYQAMINELVAGSNQQLIYNNNLQLRTKMTRSDLVRERDCEISEHFRAIFEQAAIGITNINPQGRYIRVNQRFCDMVGYNESELLEMNFQQITHPEDLQNNENYRMACLSDQIKSYSLEKRYLKKDGSIVWGNVTVSIVRDALMRPKYDIAIIEDITERKQAEALIRKEREQFFFLLEHLPAYVCLQGRDLTIRFTNRYFREHFGEPGSKRCYEALKGRLQPCNNCPNTEIFDSNKPLTWEWTRCNGRTYQIHHFPFTDSDGSELILELGIDISDRKNAEIALRQSQEMLQLVMNNIPQAICWKDKHSVYLGCNRNAANDAGLQFCEDIVGLTDWDLPCTEEQARAFRQTDANVMETDTPQYHILQQQLKANGQLAWIDTNKIPLHNSAGDVVGILVSYEDVTKHKKAQEEIIEGAQRLATVIETVGEGITLSDPEGRFIIYNSKMEEMTGYSKEEAENSRDFLRLLYPDPQAYFTALNGINQIGIKGGFQDVETKIVTKEGKPKFLLVSTSLMSYKNRNLFLSAYRDISYRVEAEEAQGQAEEKYRSLFENAIEGIFQTTADGHYLNANPALARIYGYATPQDLMASLTNIEQQLYVEPNRREDFIRRLQENDAVLEFQSQVYRFDGSIIWISENARAVRDRFGTLLYYEGTVEDITERKRLEAERVQQAERERLMGKIATRIRASLNLNGILSTAVAEIRQFLQTDRVVIYRYEADATKVVTAESISADGQSMQDLRVFDANMGVSMFVDDQFQAIEDVYQANLPPAYLDWLSQFQVRASLIVPITNSQFPINNSQLSVSMQNAQLPNSQVWGLLVAHHCHSPRNWQLQEIDLLKQLSGQLAIAIQQAELYQKLQDANLELKRIASLDGLTMIFNRRRFDEYLECEWQKSLHNQTPISLILCDVDYFKLYNDTYGHQAGDACLKKVAAALNRAVDRCLRRVYKWEMDHALEGENLFLAARYGGEEFAIVLPNRDSASALRVAKAIRGEMESLKLPHAKSGVAKFVTLSMGVSSAVADTEVFVRLVLAADQALYRAKEQGRDRIVLF